jgi:hypothetical protein
LWNFGAAVAAPSPKWLVRDLIHRKGVSLMFGESGCGKSALTMAIGLGLSGGADVLGDLRIAPSAQGAGVLYFALEGSLKTRTAPYVVEGLVQPDEVKMALDQRLSLTADSESSELKLLRGWLARLSGELGLLIVDTLARSADIDENSAELGRIAEYMHQIAEDFDIGVLLVHHSGKDASKGARGHSSLRAAVDTEIRVEVERDAEDKVVRRWFTVSKQREAEQGLSREFELRVSEIGHDDDGEPVTGIWAAILSGSASTKSRGPKAPTGKVQGVVYRVLQQLLTKAVSGDRRAQIAGVGWSVPVDDLVTAAVAALPENRDARGRDRRRELVGRALTAMSADRFIHFGTVGVDQYVGIRGFEE